jgi:amino-acid N-acetyltransferase
VDEKNDAQLPDLLPCISAWEDIAEIRSLAILPEYQSNKLGSKLVEACLSEAVMLGIYKIFVLTYKPKFFEKFGFKQVDKSVLPHKIWADCLKCVKFPDCNDIAMVLTL